LEALVEAARAGVEVSLVAGEEDPAVTAEVVAIPGSSGEVAVTPELIAITILNNSGEEALETVVAILDNSGEVQETTLVAETTMEVETTTELQELVEVDLFVLEDMAAMEVPVLDLLEVLLFPSTATSLLDMELSLEPAFQVELASMVDMDEVFPRSR